jgi:hypothetical protein
MAGHHARLSGRSTSIAERLGKGEPTAEAEVETAAARCRSAWPLQQGSPARTAASEELQQSCSSSRSVWPSGHGQIAIVPNERASIRLAANCQERRERSTSRRVMGIGPIPNGCSSRYVPAGDPSYGAFRTFERRRTREPCVTVFPAAQKVRHSSSRVACDRCRGAARFLRMCRATRRVRS